MGTTYNQMKNFIGRTFSRTYRNGWVSKRTVKQVLHFSESHPWGNAFTVVYCDDTGKEYDCWCTTWDNWAKHASVDPVVDDQELTLCRYIAARVWQDQDMTWVPMDVDKAEAIAKIIQEVRQAHLKPLDESRT